MKRKAKTSGLLIGLMVVLAAAVILLAFGVIQTQAPTGPSGQVIDQADCADATGILTVQAVSALNKATAISSPTITCGIDGGVVATAVTSGTTPFAVGAEIECLVSKADYIDEVFTFVMPCGGKTLEAPLYYATSDNPAIRAKNDDGDFMADSSGDVVHAGTNQTNVGLGEVIKWDLEISGTSLESSGDGILVIEFPAASSSNITKVELNGATATSLPTVHSTVNAGSKVVAFEVPAVVGSDKDSYVLSIELAGTKDLMGNVLMDWYAQQAFIDDDGTVSVGVEDADGTAKYENTADYDVYIMAE